MWVHPLRPVLNLLPGIDVAEGQGILVEISRKFIPEDIEAMGCNTNLTCKVHWVAEWGGRSWGKLHGRAGSMLTLVQHLLHRLLGHPTCSCRP